MAFDRILQRVERYYTDRVSEHGPTARGVDWNSQESQNLRFERLLQVCPPQAGEPSILDYGCGYGALVDFLKVQHARFRYVGFDISATMIAQAKSLHGDDPRCRFLGDGESLPAMDFAVASGIFNVRLETSDSEWQTYMKHTLDALAALSTRGFAFNALTLYSDPDRRRPDLYYADPLFWFDYCRRFSRYTALLHDYPLYEFTILVSTSP